MKTIFLSVLILMLPLFLSAQAKGMADADVTLGVSNYAENGSQAYNETDLRVRLNNYSEFLIKSPTANQNFSQDFSINKSNQIVIVVEFNQLVDPTTVIIGENFNFSVAGFTEHIPGVITWNNEFSIATFVSRPSFSNFCSFSPNCLMTLVLIGTGNIGIKDSNGCNLDGDVDSIPGGNWSTTFGILG